MELNILEDEEDMDEQPKIPESFVQAVFKNSGSIEFDFQVGKQIRPMQLLALSEYLHIIGEAGVMQEQMARLQQAEMQKIAVPEGHFKSK